MNDQKHQLNPILARNLFYIYFTKFEQYEEKFTPS